MDESGSAGLGLLTQSDSEPQAVLQAVSSSQDPAPVDEDGPTMKAPPGVQQQHLQQHKDDGWFGSRNIQFSLFSCHSNIHVFPFLWKSTKQHFLTFYSVWTEAMGTLTLGDFVFLSDQTLTDQIHYVKETELLLHLQQLLDYQHLSNITLIL